MITETAIGRVYCPHRSKTKLFRAKQCTYFSFYCLQFALYRRNLNNIYIRANITVTPTLLLAASFVATRCDDLEDLRIPVVTVKIWCRISIHEYSTRDHCTLASFRFSTFE